MAHTFVLVHGAWHGGWCWRRVADRLRRDGHVVFTPTLTGLGERAHLLAPGIDLATHVADVVNLLKWERLSDVVLCGHSYGGFVISGVAEVMPAQTRSIGFLDAFSSRERRHDPKTHRGGGSRRHSRGYAARRSRRAPAAGGSVRGQCRRPRLGRQSLRAAADRDFHVADRAQRCTRARRAQDLHSRQRLSQSQF